MRQEFGRPHGTVSATAEKRSEQDGTEALISLKDRGRHLSIFHGQISLFLALVKLPTPSVDVCQLPRQGLFPRSVALLSCAPHLWHHPKHSQDFPSFLKEVIIMGTQQYT